MGEILLWAHLADSKKFAFYLKVYFMLNFKLLIWDFDGVIVDSEKVWLKNRVDFFHQHLGVDWDFEFVNLNFGGTSDSTKKIILDKMGYKTNDRFWNDVLKLDVATMDKHGLEVFDGALDILTRTNIKQCIATGGVRTKTLHKIKVAGIQKFIKPENVFTIDNVSRGKPEPDLFLYAAEKMGELPQNCVVIEDSLAGMTAGLRAGMTVIAFLGSQMYQNKTYIEKVKKIGVSYICFDMSEVKHILFDKD